MVPERLWEHSDSMLLNQSPLAPELNTHLLSSRHFQSFSCIFAGPARTVPCCHCRNCTVQTSLSLTQPLVASILWLFSFFFFRLEGCSIPLRGSLATTAANMDVVLELFDTYIFDSIYATILPAQSALAPNATFSSLKEAPTAAPDASTWTYEPATQYISFTPGKAAYMSEWPRDDIRRQYVTLFLITWYAAVSVLVPPFTVTDISFPGSSASWSTTSSPPYPTSSSSTRPPSTTPDTSRTRSASRCARRTSPSPSWPP